LRQTQIGDKAVKVNYSLIPKHKRTERHHVARQAVG
jgi:hypothetical protein